MKKIENEIKKILMHTGCSEAVHGIVTRELAKLFESNLMQVKQILFEPLEDIHE